MLISVMRPFRRILVPVDFSPESKEALHCAESLAEKLQTPITVLHACEAPSFFGPPEVPVLATEAIRTEEEHALEDARVHLMGFLAGTTAASNPLVSMLVRIGEPSKAIIDAARDGAYDLVVMGTHGRTALSHLVLGS